MYDLIAQIEKVAAGSVIDEIRILKERRQTLDHIIKFTLGLTRLQHSLESVLLLKKPARDIPRDLLNILGNISNHVANLPSDELNKRLISIEKGIANDISTIMGVTEDPAMLLQDSAKQTQKLVNDFRRRTNTAIVLKLHLRTRGMAVNASVIPVTADDLVSQVSRLVVEEKKCREKSRDELQAMERQVELMAANESYPEQIRQYAKEMKQQIAVNIQHIDKGKDIESLPFAIEIIQMGEAEADNPQQLEVKPTDKVKNTVTVNNEQTEETAKQPAKTGGTRNGFFTKLRLWLNSSWKTRWRDLD